MINEKSVSRRQGVGTIHLTPAQQKKKKLVLNGRTYYRSGASFPTTINPAHANDNDVYVPEKWASQGVEILYESMPFASTVNMDFNEEVANFGETVHTRKPAEFEGNRKQNDLDDVEDEDAVSTGIDVTLNQRIYVSFRLGDRERSMSFKDLVNIYLREAMMAQSRTIDRCVGGMAYQFLSNATGSLGQLTDSNAHQYLLEARQAFNERKVPEENRWLAVAARSETQLQLTDLFKSAERIGDGGQALRNALLGRIANWNSFLALNTPSVLAATTDATGTETEGAFLKGVSSVDVTTGGVAAGGIVAGGYVTIAGDMTPLRVASIATDTLTFTRPLLHNVTDNAVVTVMENGTINQASSIPAGDKTAAVSDGYPANWLKKIVVDGTGVPHVGQLVSFMNGATVLAKEYCIIAVTDNGGGVYSITLDQPLAQAVGDNDVVCYGPAGDYNMTYQKDAIALVNRPLILPNAGEGVRAGLGIANGMAVRVTIGYDQKAGATRVVIDSLFGVGVLDSARGGVMLG